MKSLIPVKSREYSYWLPTYDNEYPWWSHSPQEYVGALSGRHGPAMGVLEFVTTPPVSEDFASETKVRVATIEIKGNTKIPTEAIQQSLPIQPEDIITSPQLSWLITALGEHGWFQDVRLETKQIEEAVSDQQSAISSEKEVGMEGRKGGRTGTQSSSLPIFHPSISLHIRVTEALCFLLRKLKSEGTEVSPHDSSRSGFSWNLAILLSRLLD